MWNVWRVALFCSFSVCLQAARYVDADICVYGGTSGGVIAAAAAARLGKSVALISLNSHVGGMTASGLGVTDIGRGNDTSYVGGMSREFYQRVARKYNQTGLVIWFEPHVAEEVFGDMLRDAGVRVYTNQVMASVNLTSNRVTGLVTTDGTVFRASEFIDATYEGDLMAAAGVTFTVGRESTSVYGESLAGVRTLAGSYNYDPYVTPGNPASGLLPLVQSAPAESIGQGDHRLQAFNYRLCLTQNSTNRIPITAPPGYEEGRYELVRRYVQARLAKDGSVSLDQLIHIQRIIPNGKTDINANGELSTDYVGYNYTWATNTYAGRELLRQEHENYIRGLLYFYASSTNISSNLRTEMQSWGLAKDEFQDNGGWPWQIYVREARRMVGGYVMTQLNATSQRAAPDPIALAAYNIDSHGVTRAPSGGFSRWEGSLGLTPPFPYGISYRSIIPRRGECENLFCTFALSASHVGFASCRMEPVFMMTSESAALAAVIALDDEVPVQEVDYAKLSVLLRANGQLLQWAAASISTNGIILDQGEANTAASAGWSSGANAGGWNGDYWHDGNTGKGGKWVRYAPALPTNGTYEVYAWWVPHSNRATNAIYDIAHAGGTTRVLVNQQVDSQGWYKLLTTNFNAGSNSSITIRNDGTSGYVVADAVRFLPVGDIATAILPVIEVVASDAVAGEFGTNTGRFTVVRSLNTNAAVTVSFRLEGSAVAGVDFEPVNTSVTLPAGTNVTNLFIVPIPNESVQGPRTASLALIASPGYTLTSVSNAVITIHDRPVDAWRGSAFTPLQLQDPAVSGDHADPNHDGWSNLAAYALGLPPLGVATNLPVATIENGRLTLYYSKRKNARDVALSLETSTDLSGWSSIAGDIIIELLDDDGVLEWLRARLSQPLDTAGFLRLRAVRL